jgi:hypothetical protein
MKKIIFILLTLAVISCKKDDETISINLSGDLNFTEVEIGQTSVKTLKITNTGTGVLKITSLTIPSGFEGVFVGDIAANSSQDIQITFKPVEEKEYTGQIVVNSNSQSGTGSINISGKGKKSSVLPLKLEVNFDNGTYSPLNYTTGRTDSPADADPNYNAIITNGQLVYNIPNSTLRPKLSGFLDIPQSATYAPISGDLIHEFTFTNVAQLNSLGASANTLAIAACYIRGNYSQTNGKDWTNGDTFGGFWFGFVKNMDGTKISAIRTGSTNLVSEPFTATSKASYRIYKKGNLIEFFRKFDSATDWTKIGELNLTIRSGGSNAVLITHVRILNNSDEAISVNADDFKWYF